MSIISLDLANTKLALSYKTCICLYQFLSSSVFQYTKKIIIIKTNKSAKKQYFLQIIASGHVYSEFISLLPPFFKSNHHGFFSQHIMSFLFQSSNCSQLKIELQHMRFSLIIFIIHICW